MISLELPEVVLIYDENGHVIDAEREDDAFTHTLIEMFMVEANEVLARLFEKV
jgi:ribonuclease R